MIFFQPQVIRTTSKKIYLKTYTLEIFMAVPANEKKCRKTTATNPAKLTLA